MGARLVLVKGYVQRAEDAPENDVIHLVAQSIEDRTADLGLLSDVRLNPPTAPADEVKKDQPGSRNPMRHRHPRDVRVIPNSRDFH